MKNLKTAVVAVLHIYAPVIGQLQTVSIEQSAHLMLRNPHVLWSFQWSNVPVGLFQFLSIEFACLFKPPSGDNHRIQRRIQGRNNGTMVRVKPRSCDQVRYKNDAITLSAALLTGF